MPNTLSVVIITFNEARNIVRCLQSVSPIASEIIVLDSFSTDETAQICQSFPLVRFVQREWQGYSNSKNYANSLATHSRILSIDADEELSPELQHSIRHFCENAAPNDTATLSRLTNYCGTWIRHGGWYPDRKIRIFNKKNTSWTGEIHEILVHQTACKTTLLKGELLHYSFYTDNELQAQLDKFSTIAAKSRFQKGEKSSYFKIFYKTVFKFFRNYILKAGFLDGKAGLIVSYRTAQESYWRYSKLLNLYKNG